MSKSTMDIHEEGPLVRIPLPDLTLEGTLSLPEGALGVVLFAHGSGSGRFSTRNRYVARLLREAGLGTLLIDLLSREEERIDQVTRHLRFDIPLLGRRVTGAVDWLRREPRTRALPIGIFGASTGAAAALIGAAARPGAVAAVVSRGGRPDLADEALERVRAPTLLIVGGADAGVIPLNEQARARLRCEERMELVPGATHLFEEPGTLEEVARLTADWFARHFRAAGRGDRGFAGA